jgi:ferrous iron transport protein B
MSSNPSSGNASSSQTDGDFLRVALIGNPNTGKSTIFSALCGISTRIGNYPGVTVEKKIGVYRDQEGEVQIIDLPGTYSLAARTLDEQVSVDVLLGRQSDIPSLQAVVVVADATNLERNLYLFSQVRDLGLPTILVLNMWDRVATEQINIDLDALQNRLGVCIITTTAAKKVGIEKLREAIRQTITKSPPKSLNLFPDAFHIETQQLQRWLSERNIPHIPLPFIERMVLDVGNQACDRLVKEHKVNELPAKLEDVRQSLANQSCRVPAIETRVRYKWIRESIQDIFQRPEDGRLTWSDRIDKVVTHRWWGLILFVLAMFLVFQAIYRWAQPAMDGIEWVQGLLGDQVSSFIPPGVLRSLLVDGVIAGVGSVLVFLPQILLLFFFIGILEDCGYMARAAFVMDKLMTRLGLSGKSFVPLMSSFACAVPGIMATRTIENRTERFVTILVAPLMSCSARLPVYLLLIGTFVPATTWLGGWIGLQGLTLLLMQSLGALIAIPVAWILRKTFFKGEMPPFVMELPPYKWPSLEVVALRVWERGLAFVTRAGSLIFCTAILVWAAGYFPADRSELHQVQAQREELERQIDPTQSLKAPDPASIVTTSSQIDSLQQQEIELGSRAIENSFLGMAGHWIEPAVRPLGWDWKIGVGVIASFPAREVIIATMGTIYSLGGEVTEEDEGLRGALLNAKWPDGRPVFSLPVALSIMVFFALCAQCAATLMTIQRETNSWRWAIFTFVYMTSLAYVGAWLVYRVGSYLL